MDFCQKILRYLRMQLESDSSLLRSKSELKPCITAQQETKRDNKDRLSGINFASRGSPVRSRPRPPDFSLIAKHLADSPLTLARSPLLRPNRPRSVQESVQEWVLHRKCAQWKCDEFPLVASGSVMRVAGAATRTSATENVTLLRPGDLL